MHDTDAHNAEATLTLRSQLTDLTLVGPWVDELAAKHGIADDTRFAIDLCLEEALSNVIRHGYGSEPDHTVTVDFRADGESGLTFTIEDSAPHFKPSEEIEPVETRTIDEMEPGGQGIRLMRRFASSIVYEQLPRGNRLTLGFRTTSS